MRRIWGTHFRPSEQFVVGWKRLKTENVTIDTLYLGPFELSLFRICESVSDGGSET